MNHMLSPWVAEPFSKGGDRWSSKSVENFCGLNWQLWRHKLWNMMSLTFVSNFMQCFISPQRPLSYYTLSICTTLTWAHQC